MRNLHQLCAGQLADLLAHSQYLQRLQTRLRRLLPAPLDQEVQVANYRDGVLYLQVSNAGWATRLRFLKNTLLQSWPREMAGIPQPRSIQIKLASPRAELSAAPPARHLSAETAAGLKEAAENVNYPPLQEALQRLAKNR